MKKRIFLFALLLLHFGLSAQNPESDTTVYSAAENLPYPLLNSCNPDRHPGWNQDSARQCAERTLIQLLSNNIRYPEAARLNNTQGTVVIGFIVEKNGQISQIKLLKDIGDGCGVEAVRILQAMQEAGLRWQPGTNNGVSVRMQSAIPLRFRLDEAPPFVINEKQDTVYTIVDSLPDFTAGFDALAGYVLNQMQYPKDDVDSCRTGIIEMALLIYPDRHISVENMLDYNNLGPDFEFEAIRLANRSTGLWTPAQYQNRLVTTTYPLRIVFKSPAAACASANERFDQAMLLANEAATLSDQEQYDAALVKWNEALNLSPDNTELIYYRANTLFALNRRDEGCQDYNHIKQMLGTTWFESVRRILCGW